GEAADRDLDSDELRQRADEERAQLDKAELHEPDGADATTVLVGRVRLDQDLARRHAARLAGADEQHYWQRDPEVCRDREGRDRNTEKRAPNEQQFAPST